MSKKRILGLLCLVCVALGLVAGFLWYADFLMAHRSGIIVICVIGIIVCMWRQCGNICGRTIQRTDKLLSELSQQNTLQNNAQSQANKN